MRSDLSLLIGTRALQSRRYVGRQLAANATTWSKIGTAICTPQCLSRSDCVHAFVLIAIRLTRSIVTQPSIPKETLLPDSRTLSINCYTLTPTCTKFESSFLLNSAVTRGDQLSLLFLFGTGFTFGSSGRQMTPYHPICSHLPSVGWSHRCLFSTDFCSWILPWLFFFMHRFPAHVAHNQLFIRTRFLQLGFTILSYNPLLSCQAIHSSFHIPIHSQSLPF